MQIILYTKRLENPNIPKNKSKPTERKSQKSKGRRNEELKGDKLTEQGGESERGGVRLEQLCRRASAAVAASGDGESVKEIRSNSWVEEWG
jgi:hypothetical protein